MPGKLDDWGQGGLGKSHMGRLNGSGHKKWNSFHHKLALTREHPNNQVDGRGTKPAETPNNQAGRMTQLVDVSQSLLTQ